MTYINVPSLPCYTTRGKGLLRLQFGPKSNLHSGKNVLFFFFTLFLVFVSQGCITSHINPAEFVGAILRLNVIYLTYLRAFFKTTDLCVSTRLQSSLCLIHNLLCHDDAVTFI